MKIIPEGYRPKYDGMYYIMKKPDSLQIGDLVITKDGIIGVCVYLTYVSSNLTIVSILMELEVDMAVPIKEVRKLVLHSYDNYLN